MKRPPNYRLSKSCGTCKYWGWDYEGEGECSKYPDDYDNDFLGQSTSLCDSYEESKHEPSGS